MKSYLYSSPAVQPFTGNDDYGSPQRVSVRRRPAITPAGPGMAQPYGNTFDSYDAPQSQRFSGGGQQSPMMFSGQQQQQQAAMPFEQQTRMQNSGQLARAPSLGSTLGRTRALANDPITGAIAARMPGNAPYADILSAGMAPQLQSNQMGAIGVQNAQAMAPFYPQMAQQQVRGATIQNNSAESVQPFLPQQAQADVGKTNAEAGAITAGAGATSAMMNEWQQQAQFHQQRADRLQAQLDKLTGQGQVIEKADARNNTQQRVADQGRMAGGAKAIMDSAARNPAATQPSYKDAMEQSIDANGLRGSPTTQPVQQPQPTADMGYQQSQQFAQGIQPQQAAAVNPSTQPTSRPTSQPVPTSQSAIQGGGGVINPDGSGTFNGARYVQDPGTKQWHKVKQPSTQPTR